MYIHLCLDTILFLYSKLNNKQFYNFGEEPFNRLRTKALKRFRQYRSMISPTLVKDFVNTGERVRQHR